MRVKSRSMAPKLSASLTTHGKSYKAERTVKEKVTRPRSPAAKKSYVRRSTKTIDETEEFWLRGFPKGGILHLCGAHNQVTDPLVSSVGRKRGRVEAKSADFSSPGGKSTKNKDAKRSKPQIPILKTKAVRPGARKLSKGKSTNEKEVKKNPSPKALDTENGIVRIQAETLDPKQLMVNAISRVDFLTDAQKKMLVRRVHQAATGEQERLLHEQLANFLLNEQSKYAMTQALAHA